MLIEIVRKQKFVGSLVVVVVVTRLLLVLSNERERESTIMEDGQV